jgi:hypothetical protein
MNAERFQSLADAWGGAIARWPAAEQDAAFAFLASDAAVADAVLAQARALDAMLDEAAPAMVSAVLRDRIIAAAPSERPAPGRLWRWLTGAGVGAGLAVATAAGIVAGVNVVAYAPPQSEDEALLANLYDNGLAEDAGDAS